MLIDFSVANFLSFQSEATLNMLAAASVKEKGVGAYSQSISFPDTKNRLLKTAAIYGPNASGKSNFIKAIHFFKDMVLYSFQDDRILENFNNKIFLWDLDTREDPSKFEMSFIIGSRRYRLGFKIEAQTVVEEWLYMADAPLSMREKYCYKRDEKDIKINYRIFPGARGIKEKTRKNALFISTCAQFNNEIALLVKEWLNKRLIIINNIECRSFMGPTAEKFMLDKTLQNKITDFMKLIDLGINDIKVAFPELSSADIKQPMKNIEFKIETNNVGVDNPIIKTVDVSIGHNTFHNNKKYGLEYFSLENESLGTRKVFSILDKWLEILIDGGVLIVDEFGSSLHPCLTIELLKLFQRPENKNAQLILATHDTSLLRKEILRRDQIWFVEKDSMGASELISLVEYKIMHTLGSKEDEFRTSYIEGKYNAIPIIGDIRKFINDYSSIINSDIDNE